MRSFHTSEVRLSWPDSLAVKEKSFVVTVQEMCEVPVTLRPVNPFTGSRTWLTWPPPDQVNAMSTTPVPTGGPWLAELRKSP